MDAYGYPSEEELDKIRTWDQKDFKGLLEWLRDDLRMFDGYASIHEWSDEDYDYYCISTGGWSGNEDIIAAIRENRILWLTHWYEIRRGGHHTFTTRKGKENEPEK